MISREPPGSPLGMTLNAVSTAPFPFEVCITPSDTGELRRCWKVTGPHPETGASVSQTYELAGQEQGDYLELFHNISLEFKTRLPRNRHDEPPPTLALPFRVLLDKGVSPDIWYGYGDPAVIHVPAACMGADEPWYYLLVTSNDAPNAFPILRSRSLTNWELSGFVFPAGHKPSWAEDGLGISDYWAPEMHAVGEHFLVCFAAREKGGSLAIGITRSSRPEGPFESYDAPLIAGGVIDPHLFVDGTGRTFLFWKDDSNDVWPSLLSALLHEHADLVTALFPSVEDQRTASLVLTLWPWVQALEPMERFLVQQVLIEAVVADFAGFRHRLRLLLESGAIHSLQDELEGERELQLANHQNWWVIALEAHDVATSDLALDRVAAALEERLHGGIKRRFGHPPVASVGAVRLSFITGHRRTGTIGSMELSQQQTRSRRSGREEARLFSISQPCHASRRRPCPATGTAARLLRANANWPADMNEEVKGAAFG